MSNTTDSDDSNKLLHVTASEMYPKRNNDRFEIDEATLPFSLLCGEFFEEVVKTTDGILVITNYRIYIQRSADGKTDYNIPLGLIETVENKDISTIYVICKNARVARCSFASSEACYYLVPKLTKAIVPPKSHEELFAFVFYFWAKEEGEHEIIERLGRDSTAGEEPFWAEFERLKFNDESGWRMSRANVEYKLCASYPRYLIVPTSITDNQLFSTAQFRTSNRIPAIVWRSRENGMVIARSSQPVMGVFCWRSAEDEELLKAITSVCYESCANLNNCSPKKKKLLVMDARSYISATANRARGGGYECQEYYSNCEVIFMSLPNIHSVRSSFNAIRKLCSSLPDQQKYHNTLDGTGWLQNLSQLMLSAFTVVTAIEKDVQPVLVHCSDGWDRTSQIVSLAELLLDPYYRTIQGFQTLCEREWLEFGHKFTDRCGIGVDINEKSPIFLQWLDAVQNILLQYPCAFEFSKRYLIKLAEHTYSNLFGTFLCNTSGERSRMALSQRTFSVWKYLNSPQFKNYLYDPNYERVLWPKYHVRDLHLWRELYIDLSYDNQYTLNQTITTVKAEMSNGIIEQVEDGNVATTNGHHDVTENGNLNHLGNNVNSMLESAINNCQPDLPITTNGGSSSSNSNSSSRNTREESIGSEDSIIVKLEKISVGEVAEDEECTSEVESDVVKDNNDENEDGLNNDDVEDIFYGLDSNADNDSILKESNDTLSKSDVTIKMLKSALKHTNESSSMNRVRPVTNAPVQLDPIDGLPLIPDEIQDRMQQISYEDKSRQAALENELHSMRMTILSGACKCEQLNITNTSPDKQPTTDDDGSECSTEVSWEAVEEKETRVTLWMPDHAIANCQSCNNKFWLGRRKHHCRSCGQIFCADCCRNLLSLPNEQLYVPVRVCEKCYYDTCYHKQTMTCKQAAADEEIKSQSMLLPPTQPI